MMSYFSKRYSFFPAQQCGATIIEFSVTAMIIILFSFLIIEVMHVQSIRHIIQLALLEAARAGSTSHAHPQTMETAFERALQPLFISTNHDRLTAIARMHRQFASIEKLTGLPAWQIQILQPNTAAFKDFASPLPLTTFAVNRPTIRNDYQAEQHQRYQKSKGLQGIGASSGMTIFQANVLRLRLTYLYLPFLPLIRALLKGVSKITGGSTAATMGHSGALTLHAEIVIHMQSHPIAWEDSPYIKSANNQFDKYIKGKQAKRSLPSIETTSKIVNAKKLQIQNISQSLSNLAKGSSHSNSSHLHPFDQSLCINILCCKP